MSFLSDRLAILGAVLAIGLLPGDAAFAQKRYDTGASDTEIRIGNFAPYSGPAAAYGMIGKVEAAYFKKINDEGGINGRKINFISYDDAYSPPKAVEQTRKLVESDQVLAMFGMVGTPSNSAIQRYLNAKKVPQLFVASGATKWGQSAEFPWTMGLQPPYQSEARVFAKYILQARPNAKIGVLFQNDDFGKDLLQGLKDGLGARAASMIVLQESYDVSEPAVDPHIVNLQRSGADVFVSFATPKFAAQSIKKAAEIGWKPLYIQTSVSASIGSVLRPAGVDLSQGIISVSYLRDASDPAARNDAGMSGLSGFLSKYLPDTDKNDSSVIYAYVAAQAMVQVLRQAGDDLTRENVMRQAASLRDFAPDGLLPGIRINTAANDFYPIEQLQLMRFKGERWERFGDAVSAELGGRGAPSAPAAVVVNSPPAAETQPASVRQRAVLYDEDTSDPKGKSYVGTVTWRTETVKGTKGKPDELAVRADVEIPDRKFKMTFSLRRNTDTSLPASHTAEMEFKLPSDFADGGVASAPGILMKSNEQTRGTPLAGLGVKVTDNFFLVGFSDVEADKTKNLQLLKDREWFDVPLTYERKRRAILAFEKGEPGGRAFTQAFAAWGQSVPSAPPPAISEAKPAVPPPQVTRPAVTTAAPDVGRRVALVMGNSTYRYMPTLSNPKNDAIDVESALKSLGFETVVATDLDRLGMNAAVSRFARLVAGADVAMVYYSGHGMQFNGKNYLLPTDANLESASDVNRFTLMPVDDVVEMLGSAKGLQLIVLDACRNNPVERDFKNKVASVQGANRDAAQSRGFSRIDARSGLLVTYATAANDVASDGDGRNSPFTKAFLKNVVTPDLEVRQMLYRVQSDVYAATGSKQLPEISSLYVGPDIRFKSTTR